MAVNGIFEAVVPTVVRTLSLNGFRITGVERRTNYYCCCAERYELLGVPVRYLLVVAERNLEQADLNNVQARANRSSASPVLVVAQPWAGPDLGFPVFSLDQFHDRLGGAIHSVLPLQPEYCAHLEVLGHNAVPAGLNGTADDLFEENVHAGLQFVLGRRVIRYGQERRFEAVPDGVAFDHAAALILYDAKAARNGYAVDTTSARQFGDYVRRFDAAYERLLGRLSAFVVVSGSFENGDESLEDRARDFLAEYGCPLSFMTASEMGAIVNLLAAKPLFRRSIDWKRVFSRAIVRVAGVQAELDRLNRDRLIGGQ